MAANDFVLAYQPNLTGLMSVKNTDGANDLVAGDMCKLDTANPISATNAFICVVRAGATGDKCVFPVLDNIPKTKTGRVACAPGSVVRVVAGAAITLGDPLMCTTVGQVIAQTAALPQVGYALSSAAGISDQILMLFAPAKNA